MITPASFDLANETEYDIFKYFREKYSVPNLNDKGIVTITASTTEALGDNNRTNASILISEPDGGRWVSYGRKNQYLLIDFHKNSIDLIGYSFLTNIGVRFINSWDVYGVVGKKLYLLDRKVDTPLCSGTMNCEFFYNFKFRTQKPVNFHKFLILHTKPDSHDENRFSLSNIRFYGAVNSYFLFQTSKLRQELKGFLNFFLIFLGS